VRFHPNVSGDPFGPWHEHAIVMFDVETTGLDRDKDRVVEVGFPRFEHGNLVARWGTLINPGMPIPKASSSIHGIKDADVAGCPSFTAAMGQMLKLTRRAWPAAYNASFDKSFLLASVARSSLELSGAASPIFNADVPWLDPLVWERKKRGVRGNKLVQACERYGIDTGNSHRAEDDAVAAGLVMMKAMKEMMPASTMAGVLSRQHDLAEAHEAEFASWRR